MTAKEQQGTVLFVKKVVDDWDFSLNLQIDFC